MALNIKVLANGELPLVKATLYTVPALKAAFIRVLVVNKSASFTQINIYYKKSGGSSRQMCPRNMDFPTRYKCDLEELPFALEAGDQIEGDATLATSVDYVLYGALEDLVITS